MLEDHQAHVSDLASVKVFQVSRVLQYFDQNPTMTDVSVLASVIQCIFGSREIPSFRSPEVSSSQMNQASEVASVGPLWQNGAL